MGIRVVCPNGHKLNVKAFLAGKRGVCPHCGAKFAIPSDAADDGTPAADTASAPAPAPAPVTPSVPAATPTAEPSVPASQPAQSASPPSAPAQSAPAQVAPVQPATPQATAPVQAVASPIQPQAAPVQPAATQPVQPAAPDPFVEAPDAGWYVRPPTGGQYGPAKADVMRQWMDEGRVTPDSLVWREGWADWKLAAETFPSMGATAAPAPAVSATATAAPVQPAGESSEEFPSFGPSGRSAGRATNYRRKDNTGRFVAIGFLFIALIVLTALLVYVLVYQNSGEGNDTRGRHRPGHQAASHHVLQLEP